MKSAKIAALFLALSLLTAGTAGIAEEATHTHVYTCKYLDKDYHVYVCSQCGTQTKEKHSLTELGTCMDCNATGLSTGSGSTGSSTKKKKT